MKKTVFLLFVVLGFSLSNLLAQELSYDIKVRYNTNNSPVTADILVTVSQGSPAFSFYLMTNDPLRGEIISESVPVDKKTFTFRDVEPGQYFLKIVDSRGMVAGKTVEILSSGKN